MLNVFWVGAAVRMTMLWKDDGEGDQQSLQLGAILGKGDSVLMLVWVMVTVSVCGVGGWWGLGRAFFTSLMCS